MTSADTGKPIYAPLSDRWREWLAPLKKPMLLYRSLQLVRCEFEITSGTDSAPLPCLYIGEGLNLEYYRKLYGSAHCSPSTPIPVWSLRAEIARARSRYPVTLVENNQLLDCLLPAGGLVTDPWIRQQTDLAGERYRLRQRGIERGVGRSVRIHNFQCRFSREARDLEAFYSAYYLPHIHARHGTLAAGRSLAQLRKALRSGFLLQVWRGDRWVSGLVAERTTRERICPLVVGLHPAHLAAWQNGALAAGYYFLFRWARENGVRIVDLGGSRPHLMDGVFHHKTLWASVAERDPWHHTEIVFYLDPAVRLPSVVSQQLVWKQDRLLTIAESLPAAALTHCFDATAPSAGTPQATH